MVNVLDSFGEMKRINGITYVETFVGWRRLVKGATEAECLTAQDRAVLALHRIYLDSGKNADGWRDGASGKQKRSADKAYLTGYSAGRDAFDRYLSTLPVKP